MRFLATATLVLLLGTPSWAEETAPLDTTPLVLDFDQLDRVAAGDRHVRPLYMVIYNNQHSLLALRHAPSRGSAGRAPRAVREHVLLARQVGLSIRD